MRPQPLLQNGVEYSGTWGTCGRGNEFSDHGVFLLDVVVELIGIAFGPPGRWPRV